MQFPLPYDVSSLPSHLLTRDLFKILSPTFKLSGHEARWKKAIGLLIKVHRYVHNPVCEIPSNMFLWRLDQLSTSEVLATRESISPILRQRQERRVSQQLNKSCSSSSKNSGIIWQNVLTIALILLLCVSVVTLLVIVVMYLMCNVPRLTLNTAEYILRWEFLEVTLWENGFQNVTLNWKKYISTQWKSYCHLVKSKYIFLFYF